MKLLRTYFVAASVLAALAPLQAFACATCHGASDSPLAYGMNWGIFTLMGVILTVLGSIAAFFVHVARRGADVNKDSDAKKSTDSTDL